MLRLVHLKPRSGYSNDSVSLYKALLQWLDNCNIKNSLFQNYSRFSPYLKRTMACKARFKGIGYLSNPNQMSDDFQNRCIRY